MIENYKQLKEIKDKPKLLLHCCCGPCSTYVIEFLQPYFTLTAYYYNPNTQPYDEYIKRLEELKKVTDIYKIDLIVGDYDDSFDKIAIGMEKEIEGGKRCYLCYENRIKNTYLKTKELGFDYYTTTLSVSPYKKEDIINKIGFSYSDTIKFVYSNFKLNDGYRKSIMLSKKYFLYRQKYCGCLFSITK